MSVGTKMIGIVGGLGPYAGLDLYRKILDQTDVVNEREHIPVALLPVTRPYEYRILDSSNNYVNIVDAIFNVLLNMEQIGVRVAGIACNAAHTPHIFDVVLKKMREAKINIKVVNMINETADFIKSTYPEIKNVGVLCTTDTYKSKIHEIILGGKGIKVILPDEVLQKNVVNKAIYDLTYGIKARSNPVTDIAKRELMNAINYLLLLGAEAIVLGCTEIPLAVTDKRIKGKAVIDSTLVLDRALIREVKPAALKPLSL
jgi:aspartate racemase